MKCARGCGKPVKIRGMCNAHYQARRTKWIRANLWQGPIPVIGTSRRLRALCAIGWNQAELSRRTGLPTCTISHLVRADITRTSLRNAELVHGIYEKLSMTTGPSGWQRKRARAAGWAPPLAWDDDSIDDPQAQPDLGDRQPLSWADRYRELREDLGLSDEQIAARMGIAHQSLLRQLDRHGITA